MHFVRLAILHSIDLHFFAIRRGQYQAEQTGSDHQLLTEAHVQRFLLTTLRRSL